MSNRAPVFIFFSSFFTFAAAFVGLMWMSRNAHDTTAVVKGDLRPSASIRAPSPGTEETGETSTALSGTLQNSEGDLLAGARVYLLAPADESNNLFDRIVDTTTTSSDGSFEFLPVAKAGLYELILSAPGFARARVGMELTEGRGAILGDFRLNSGGELVFRVRDERGRAIERASVVVRDPLASEVPELARADLTGVTDKDGLLTLRGADFGTYDTVISKEGFDVWQESFPFQVEDQRSRRSVNATVNSASAYLEGKVVDPVGLAIGGGSVRAVSKKNHASLDHSTTIDSSGRFRIGPIPDGDYELYVTREGVRQKNAVHTDTATSEIVVLEVEYGGVARGRILATSSPSAAVTLDVSYEDRHGRLVPFSGTLRTRVDPQTLEFEVDGLSPGSYQIRASSAGFAGGRSKTFSLGAGSRVEDLSVRLGPGGRLTGRIVGVRGEPLEGVRVTAHEGEAAPPTAMLGLLGNKGLIQTYTHADGTFTVERLSPGSISLVFDAKGLPTRTIAPLVVEENGALRLGHLYMGAGASISGALLESKSEKQRRILVRSDDNLTWLLLGPSKTGNYCVQGLPEGKYFVQQLGKDYAPISDEVSLVLREAEHRRLDFEP